MAALAQAGGACREGHHASWPGISLALPKAVMGLGENTRLRCNWRRAGMAGWHQPMNTRRLHS
jgi:hypothetical protein